MTKVPLDMLGICFVHLENCVINQRASVSIINMAPYTSDNRDYY
jgi:hypothetical protein